MLLLNPLTVLHALGMELIWTDLKQLTTITELVGDQATIVSIVRWTNNSCQLFFESSSLKIVEFPRGFYTMKKIKKNIEIGLRIKLAPRRWIKSMIKSLFIWIKFICWYNNICTVIKTKGLRHKSDLMTNLSDFGVHTENKLLDMFANW